MALPDGIETTRVTGTYTEWDGTPCAGAVTFTLGCSCYLIDTETGTVIAGSLTVPLDGNGHFEVDLPTAGQDRLIPSDFCFHVTEETTCGCARSYTISTECASPVAVTDGMHSLDGWADVSEQPTAGSLTQEEDEAASDGQVMAAHGYRIVEFATNIPYDDTLLYEVSFRVRTAVQPSNEATLPYVYLGFTGVAADGTTRISMNGLDEISYQHFLAARRTVLDQSPEYTTYTGYATGFSTTAADTGYPHTDPLSPGAMYAGVAFVRPVMFLLYRCADGLQLVDSVTVTATDPAVPETGRALTVCSLDLADVLNTN